METNKELLKTNAEQYAKKRSVDPSRIDFESLLDKQMTEGENWEKIREEVKSRMDAEERLEEDLPSEEEIKAKEREIEEKYIEQLEKEREETLEEQFIGDADENVNEFYKMYNHYLKSVAKGHHTAVMYKADPGLGKSYQTTQTLMNEVGKDKFETAPAVSSPFEFYKKLWKLEQHEEKEILVLDDIEGLLRKKKALSILKQATWSETDDRMVGWSSSPSKLQTEDGRNIPSKFEFTGKLVMIFNEVPNDIIFESLKDRCFYYELSFSYEQKAELLKAVADKGMGKGVPKEQRKEIAHWLISMTNPTMDGLNLRTFEKALLHYKACEDIDSDMTWKDLVADSLNVDEELAVVWELVKDTSYDSVGERKKQFAERTDMSPRAYNRKRDELEENSDHIKEILENR